MTAGHGDFLPFRPELNGISGDALIVLWTVLIPLHFTQGDTGSTHTLTSERACAVPTRFQVAAEPGGLSPGHVSAAPEECPEIALW